MLTDPKSRYSIYGQVTHKVNGRLTTTSVGSPAFDDLITDKKAFLTGRTGKIPAGFAHRPDLISNLFYNTPKYWWLILLANNIADPFDRLNEGDEIFIPELV